MSVAQDDQKRMIAQARQTFATHVFRFRDDEHHHWVLGRPPGDGWGNAYSAEIVALRFGMLYVGGDIDTVVFGQANARGVELVRWIGGTEDVGYYVLQKASIGMGDTYRHLTTSWSWEACEVDVRELAGQVDDERLSKAISSLLEAVDEVGEPEGREAFLNAAYDALAAHDENMDAMGCFGDLGVRIAWRVVYAHAALRRLLELLQEGP